MTIQPIFDATAPSRIHETRPTSESPPSTWLWSAKIPVQRFSAHCNVVTFWSPYWTASASFSWISLISKTFAPD